MWIACREHDLKQCEVEGWMDTFVKAVRGRIPSVRTPIRTVTARSTI